MNIEINKQEKKKLLKMVKYYFDMEFDNGDFEAFNDMTSGALTEQQFKKKVAIIKKLLAKLSESELNLEKQS